MKEKLLCSQADCVFCNNEECRFSLVKDRYPEIVNKKCKDYVCRYPLKEFIKNEVPFRLDEILNLDASDEVVEYIIESLWEKNDVMFDYDSLDDFIEEKFYESENKNKKGE